MQWRAAKCIEQRPLRDEHIVEVERLEQPDERRIEQRLQPPALVDEMAAHCHRIEHVLGYAGIISSAHAAQHRPQARLAAHPHQIGKRHAKAHEPARVGNRAGVDQHGARDQRRAPRGERHQHLPAIALTDKDGALDRESTRDFDEIVGVGERGVGRRREYDQSSGRGP